jgi:undecaprenyl diphosphate synthase
MAKTTLKHLAVIMDGNGRWAQQRGLTRTKGHEKGAEIIRNVTTYCAKHPSIESVTFYAFSTENWKRPKLEVDFLMRLLDRYLKNELETYQDNNVRFKAIGDLKAFSPKLQERIRITTEETRTNTDLTHILALNYGGRAEITTAVNKLISEGKKKISEADISSALQTRYHDIDLLLRTI